MLVHLWKSFGRLSALALLFVIVLSGKMAFAQSAYDGTWRFEYHRFNTSSIDANDINGRTLLTEVTASVSNGKFSLVSYKNYASKKDYSNKFRASISKSGQLKTSIVVDALFGEAQEHIKSTSAKLTLPATVSNSKTYQAQGKRLWKNTKPIENVYLLLKARKIK